MLHSLFCNFFLLGFIFLFFNACQTPSKQSNETSTVTSLEPESSNIESTDSLQLIPCESPTEEALYNGVFMQAFTYQQGKFMFGVNGIALGGKTAGAELKKSAISKKGNYIHVVFNDKEHYTHDYQHFIYDLPNGEYTLFAFLSRSYHESIKNPEAAVAKRITIKNKQLYKSQGFEEAAIALNAPRGLYKNDDTKQVVLDFHLFNTTVSANGNKVRVLIDNKEFILDNWQAQYIKGLRLGMHSVEVSLLDANGKVIYGPVAERFVLTEEPENS